MVGQIEEKKCAGKAGRDDDRRGAINERRSMIEERRERGGSRQKFSTRIYTKMVASYVKIRDTREDGSSERTVSKLREYVFFFGDRRRFLTIIWFRRFSRCCFNQVGFPGCIGQRFFMPTIL